MILGDAASVLWLLFLVSGLVWLIGTANVAALLTVRIVERRGEFAIRCAIGGTIKHILTSILEEMAVVCAIGAIVGLFIASACLAFIRGHAAWYDLPRLADVSIDPAVLVAAAASAIAGCLLAVLLNLPAIIRLASSGSPDMREGQRSTRTSRFTQVTVAVQLCFAVVVLNAGMLTGRSLLQVQGRPIGYDPRHVVAMQVWYGDARVPQPTLPQELIDFARQLPRVQSATGIFPRPTIKDFMTEFSLGPGSKIFAVRRDIAANYFGAMDVALRSGRAFRAGEGPSSGVVIVNDEFVRLYSPRQQLVGRSLSWRYTGAGTTFQIVGVSGDVLATPLDAGAPPTVYFPGFRNVVDLLVRTDNGQGVTGAVRQFVHSIDNSIPVLHAEALETALSAPLSELRVQSFLTLVFGLASLFLAIAGLYGVVRHAGESRRREYAVHLAVGATHAQLIRRRLAQVMQTAVIGLGLGAVASVLSGRIVSATLFRVGGNDPFVLGGALAVLLAFVLGASYISIRGTSAIEVSELLRSN